WSPQFRLFCILNFNDGSQDWVIAHNDEVAGSSPASGTKRRSSSVVEHVFPVRLLSVGFSAWRILNDWQGLAKESKPSQIIERLHDLQPSVAAQAFTAASARVAAFSASWRENE